MPAPTWTVRTVPGSASGETDPHLDIGPGRNKVYFAFSAGSTYVADLARTSGQTWSAPIDLGSGVRHRQQRLPRGGRRRTTAAPPSPSSAPRHRPGLRHRHEPAGRVAPLRRHHLRRRRRPGRRSMRRRTTRCSAAPSAPRARPARAAATCSTSTTSRSTTRAGSWSPTRTAASAPARAAGRRAARRSPASRARWAASASSPRSTTGPRPRSASRATPIGDNVVVEWFPADDLGTPVTGYVIERSTDGVSFAQV